MLEPGSMSRQNGVTCSGFLPDSISSQAASATMRIAVEVVSGHSHLPYESEQLAVAFRLESRICLGGFER